MEITNEMIIDLRRRVQKAIYKKYVVWIGVEVERGENLVIRFYSLNQDTFIKYRDIIKDESFTEIINDATRLNWTWNKEVERFFLNKEDNNNGK